MLLDSSYLKKTPTKRDRAFSIFFVVIIILTLLIVFFKTFYKKVYVVGTSMESTLHGADSEKRAGGDYVYIFEAQPERGDIVVINTGSRVIIKRVIALGGDTVELKAGKLYLNDELVEESYVSDENNTPTLKNNTYFRITVPDGEFFFLGDNRDVSIDSRSEYGCLSTDAVIGVVADWSITFKSAVTAFNTFWNFTLPSLFGI